MLSGSCVTCSGWVRLVGARFDFTIRESFNSCTQLTSFDLRTLPLTLTGTLCSHKIAICVRVCVCTLSGREQPDL